MVVFEITASAPKPTSWLFLCTHLLGVGDLRRPVLRFVGVLQNPRQTVNDDTLAPGSNFVLHVWWCLIQMQFFRFNMTCTLFYHFQNTQQILWKVMKKKVWKRALDSQVASPGLFKRVTCLALMVSAGSPSETPFQKEKIIFNICIYIHSTWNAEVYSFFLQLSKVTRLKWPLGKLNEFLILDFKPATLMFFKVL